MGSIIIGIDLGTTNSVCSYIDRNEPRIMINEEGGRVTPSIVGFGEDGTSFVGDVAKRQMVLNPDLTIYGIKRFVGKKFEIVEMKWKPSLTTSLRAIMENVSISVLDREYSAQEISAMILKR